MTLLLVVGVILCTLQLAVPRRHAPIVLLIAVFHTPNVDAIAGLSVARCVLLAGLARGIAAGWIPLTRQDGLAKLFFLFALVMPVAALAHSFEARNPVVGALGWVVSTTGGFLYARCYLSTVQDIQRLPLILALVLLPQCLLSVYEALTRRNLYNLIGARLEMSVVRGGRPRAGGPFGTPILAGSAAALVFPLLHLNGREYLFRRVVGSLAVLGIVVSARSSTPVGLLGIGTGILLLWRFRRAITTTRLVSALAVGSLIYYLWKGRGIWHLLSRIDITGGSTGAHRSMLWNSGIKYIGEWWVYGTDYTRHWIPYGLPSDPNHVDLTNHLLLIGVKGGLLPAVLVAAAMLYVFKGLLTRSSEEECDGYRPWLAWCVLASVSAVMLGSGTIAYFDNTCILVSVILGVGSIAGTEPVEQLSDCTDDRLASGEFA